MVSRPIIQNRVIPVRIPIGERVIYTDDGETRITTFGPAFPLVRERTNATTTEFSDNTGRVQPVLGSSRDNPGED
jgi:hypothetical protein